MAYKIKGIHGVFKVFMLVVAFSMLTVYLLYNILFGIEIVAPADWYVNQSVACEMAWNNLTPTESSMTRIAIGLAITSAKMMINFETPGAEDISV